MRFEPFVLWTGPLIALAAAAAAALLLRAMKRQALAGIAPVLGVAAGWIATLGIGTASPRQLFERLPLLALAALAAGLPAAATTRPVLLWPIALLGAGATGWWMAGAPLTPADLLRAAQAMAAVGAGVLAVFLLLREDWQGLAAALALVVAFAASGPVGPLLLLAAALAAATLGGWVCGAGAGPAMRLPLAMAVAGLAAVPVIARGQPSDWLAAAAPLAALLLGPPVARRMPAAVTLLLASLLATLPIVLAIAWLAGRL